MESHTLLQPGYPGVPTLPAASISGVGSGGGALTPPVYALQSGPAPLWLWWVLAVCAVLLLTPIGSAATRAARTGLDVWLVTAGVVVVGVWVAVRKAAQHVLSGA
jgi:hypothetical protein